MKPKNQTVLVSFGVAVILFFSCGQQEEEKVPEPGTTRTESPIQQPQKITDSALLVGDWERTDAAYQLKISTLLDDGAMKAAYFNPRPINVAKAMWVSTDGSLRIYVELRDKNYPGSNYTLTYLPDKDMLTGRYYQAVEGATYDVSFARKK